MNSKHQLSFDVINLEPQFYSNVTIPEIQTSLPFVNTRTSGYEARYISARNKEFNNSFLITHSFGRFIGHQEKEISVHNDTFIMDLSRDFTGNFISEGVTNAFILPFDLLPGGAVDRIKMGQISASPLFFAIEHLMKTTRPDDQQINSKIEAIIANLSVLNLEDENKNNYADIVMFMKLALSKGHRLNLDLLCEQFYMSRRKMQYVFEKNDTTFMKTMKSLRAKNEFSNGFA